MTKVTPYVLMVFAILSSAAFLRKALFVGEISIADCVSVIFSLLLVSILYAFNEYLSFQYSKIESHGLAEFKKEVASELREIRSSIDFITKEQEGNGGF
jgi:hypothetical protein